MSTKYQIQLDIVGNAEQKLENIESRAGRLHNTIESLNGKGGSGKSARLNTTQERLARNLDRFGAGGVLVSSQNLKKNLDNLTSNFNKLSGDFARNSLTIWGARRNIGNFADTVSAFTRTLTDMIPLLSGALAGAKAYIGLAAAPIAIGGIGYLAGNRILQSRNLSEAISNITQHRTARMGLGSDYDRLFAEASEIAALYGYSRTGVLNAINTFSGFGLPNGGQITQDQAVFLSRVAGKISQSSGRPYDIVNLNLQQILGNSSPNARDLRELINQAPLISKLAQQRQRAAGQTGDPRDYLKNANNLLSVLAEFDQLINPPKLAALKGKLTLRKENLWITVANELEPFLEDVTTAGLNLYDTLENTISRFAHQYDSDYWQRQFQSFNNAVENLATFLFGAAGASAGLVETLSEYPRSTIGGIAGLKLATKLPFPFNIIAGIGGFGSGFTADQFYNTRNADRRETYDQISEITDDAITSSLRSLVGREYPQGIEANRLDSIVSNYRDALPDSLVKRLALSIPTDTIRKNALVLPTAGIAGLPLNYDSYQPNPTPSFKDDVYEAVANIFDSLSENLRNNSSSNSNSAFTSQLQDMTSGRRSLILNFNREVVRQEFTLSGTPQDQLDEYARVSEEAFIRGLTTVLNSATGQ